MSSVTRSYNILHNLFESFFLRAMVSCSLLAMVGGMLREKMKKVSNTAKNASSAKLSQSETPRDRAVKKVKSK